MSYPNKFVTIAVILLTAGVLILGWFALNQRGIGLSSIFKTSSGSSIPTASDVLNLPKANAPKSEFDQYNNLVESRAKDATVLTLAANCKPDPLVLHVKPDVAVNIKNSDTVPHTINFNKDNLYKLNAGETKSFSPSQFAPNITSGGYTYGCDSTYPIGVFWFKF